MSIQPPDNSNINKHILNILEEYLDMHPDTKFGQALYNTGIIPIITHVSDYYYEPSEITLKNIEKRKLLK